MGPKLTRAARSDLEEIRTYTLARWGRPQWLRYFAGLSAAFDRIASNPQCGVPRDAFHPGLRSISSGRHVIFFVPVRHAAGAVVVVRIVHQRRNLAALAFAVD